MISYSHQKQRTCGKRFHLSAVVLPLILLGGCDGNSGREREAIERVKEQLLDPESARFRNVHEGIEREGGWIVCGEVNAKNEMGGHTGYRKFSMSEKEGDILFADESAARGVVVPLLIEELCHFPDDADQSG